MPASRPRRSGGDRVSYNYKEAFKGLELSGSEGEGDQEIRDFGDEDEPDDFVPPEEEEEDEADANGSIGEAEEDDDQPDDDDDETRRQSVIDTSLVQKARAKATPKTHRQVNTPQRRNGTPVGGSARQAASNAKGTGPAKLRQRAVEEWGIGGQESRLRNLFGPSIEDLKPVFEAKNRWLSQSTFPSREQGHLAPSPFVSDETREKEAKALRSWWRDAGQDIFARGQRTRHIDEAEAQKYLVNDGPESISILAGGIKDQEVHTIKKGKHMSVATAFGPDSTRCGWTLHMGSRIQDIHWAPIEDGSMQYLAVAVEQKDREGERYEHLDNPKAPAFSPMKPFCASVQIWAFAADLDGSLDVTKEPRLAQVICTDWGAPKMLRWWPVGIQDASNHSSNDAIHIGLLAGIWSDGKIRILDVSQPKSAIDSGQTYYVHCTNAAYEFNFASTVPSCLLWLSPTSIAAGTASGMIAIWTLTHPGCSRVTSQENPRYTKPWFYKQVSDTYIVTLASGSPSLPHFLSITTADGFAILLDIRSSTADAAAAPRGRMLILTQAWHEHTQSFVMPDEYYMLRHSSVRRYYQSMYSYRVGSSISAVATSRVHPGVLIGTSDGEIICSNGLCKMLNSKELPWGQLWFKHEWRRAQTRTQTQEPQSDSIPVDPSLEASVNQTGERAAAAEYDHQPLVRITEGYLPMQTGMQHPESTKRYKEGAKFVTIFEELSAVAKMCWNPNVKFGTWAVAGMHSGLLRVEDVCV